MLFQRYVKLTGVGASSVVNENLSIDSGHGPLTDLTVTVTVFADTLVQVGYFLSGACTYKYTRLIKAGTSILNFPNYVNDGSQDILVAVTNLDSVSHDIYLDLEADEV